MLAAIGDKNCHRLRALIPSMRGIWISLEKFWAVEEVRPLRLNPILIESD
jgi:hypothetical protein